MSSLPEKPFGPIYTQADYNFLAAMNDKIGWKGTPQEEETKNNLKIDQRLDSYLTVDGSKNELDSILNEIKEKQGVDVRYIRKNELDNIFALAVNPIRFTMVQGERRTRVLFEPRTDNRFDPYFLFGLFLVDLPKALYGESRDAPSPGIVREATTFTVVDIDGRVRELSMEVPNQKVAFEKALENPDDVVGIKMSCDGIGVSHSLIYPNPKIAKDSPVQFSFPSRHAITPEAMDVLLGIHRDGFRLAPGNKTFSHAFAGAVNSIREQFRIR